MKDLGYDILIRCIKALNAVLLAIPFIVVWFAYYAPRTADPFVYRGNFLIIALFVLLYVFFCRVYDGFLVSINRISELVYSQSLAVLIADGIMFIVIWLLTKQFPNPLPGLAALVVQIVLSAVWCVLAHKWYFATYPPKKSGVIYDDREGLESLIHEYGLEKKFEILLTATSAHCLENLQILDGLEVLFISGVHSHERNLILKYCVEHSIQVYVIPRVGDTIMIGAKRMHMFHLPMLRVGRYHPVPEYLFLKRLFDILISACALVILSPVMLVTAIAIKATDGGPVFYRQRRLTKDGKSFNILKFRSMREDAEKDGVARLSTGEQDDRVTPVGRVIRRVRIDELPQLINVIIGDLAICGPRPERPEIAAQYMKEMPDFALRLQAKAGLTGYAQVYGKYNTTPYDKLLMDLMYISHPSIVEDLRIILATIKILFMPESTEGIAEGSATAMKQVENTENGDKMPGKILCGDDLEAE